MSILPTHEQVPQINRPIAVAPHRTAPMAATGMTGKDILRAVRKRIWTIVISVLVAGVLMIVGTKLWEAFAPLYTADAYLGLNPPKPSAMSVSAEQTSREIMDRMITQYTHMFKSDAVMNSALKMEGVPDSKWFNKDPATALQRIMKDVDVSPMSNEGLIRISMTGTDKKEVTNIVNAVALAAREDSATYSNNRAREWSKNFSDELKSREDAQDELARKIAAAHPADVSLMENQRSTLSMKLEQINHQIVELGVEQVRSKSEVDRMDKMDMRNSVEVIQAVDQDPALRSMKMLRSNLETERDNALRKFGPGHRAVMDIQTRINSIDKQIAQMETDVTNKAIAATRSFYEGKYSTATQQLLDLTTQLDDAKAGMKGLEDALQKIQDYQKQNKRLDDQIKQLQDKLMDVNLLYSTENPISLRRPATTPLEPTWPKSLFVMVPLGVLFGLIVGFTLVFLLEFTDTSVKSPADITRRVDLAVLGTVPHSDDLEEEIEDLRLAFASNPNSLVSEAFRQIRTCLLFSGPANQRRSLLIASAQPEDGRTTVALNLAASMARGGRKILVVDANFRQPAVRRLFPQSKDVGLSNVLVGQADWRDHVSEVEPNLSVLTSGPLPPNPAELLGSESMRKLIADMASQYDQVIFDGAPVLVVSDSAVLATLVDGVVLVVRAGANTYGIVQRMREMLQRVGAKLLGVVLNGVRATAGGYLRKSYETFYDYHERQALPGEPDRASK